ncbi:MAG: UDP-N-acetylglucosamine 2-epimerase (non-hydrolyzing), partial [Deltaproteobacteria bacterium]
MKRLALVVGARPNYFKAMPVLRLLDAKSDVQAILVHTGQHYDPRLYEELFVEIGLRKPDVYLGIEDRSRRPTVAEMISSCDSWCRAVRPDAVVVCGDVDSTAACALAAHYAGIPVAHVEAGLRSGDREMPEEINRMVTDAVSRLLLVSDPAGVENLRREGRNDREIRLVGNVMIDTLLDRLPVARRCGFDEPVQERV